MAKVRRILVSGSFVESLEQRLVYSTMSVDFNSLGGALNKPGLGSLFGAASLAGGTAKGLIDGSTLTLSVAMDKPGQVGANPMGLANVAPLVAGTKAKLIPRFADMLNGFPYNWVSVADWDSKIAFATNLISATPSYKSALRCIAVFNEPDANFGGAFLTDSTIPVASGDKYGRINWLWTHTANEIRAIDASLPLMGPNFLFYNPHITAGEGTVMRNFLINARDTNTLPDMVGWHPLLTYNAADVRLSVQSYRATESALGISARPIVQEEYGFNNDSFAGVPSSMVPFWAEMERSGVSYACAGVYDNGGTLGNILRHWSDTNQQVNAGYFMHNWYMNMAGVSVPSSPGSTRYAGAYDGIASWDSTSQTGTVILAGPDDQATIQLQSIAARLGNKVRVTVEEANWTTTTNEWVGSTNTPNPKLMRGGDAINAPIGIYDRVLTPDASGTIALPLHVEAPNGYRITLTRAPASGSLTASYEAEAATQIGTTIAASAAASGGSYVSSLDSSGDALTFNIDAASNGLYEVVVRYLASDNTSNVEQTIAVNGVAQGTVRYARTPAGVFADVTKLVQLKAGANTITFGISTGVANLDRITLAPADPANAAQKYEAENALISGGAISTSNIASNGRYVGGLSTGSSNVTFTMTVPAAGTYTLATGFAASGIGTDLLSVNGTSQGTINFANIGNALSALEGVTDRTVTLIAGVNTIVYTRVSGSTDLDYIALSPSTPYKTKYEAEQATRTNVATYNSGTASLASGTGYVGGIDFATSSVSFIVNVPALGLYDMNVRYAANLGAATHALSVNYQSQGEVSYAQTNGWSTNDLRTTTKLVALQAGPNVITFAKGTSFAELDFISLAPDTHRYDAAGATLTGVNRGVFPKAYTGTYYNDVVGINDAGDSIQFSVVVPIAGNYALQTGYGNGSGSAATHSLTVNGIASGLVAYPTTAGWLGNLGPAGRQLATNSVTLNAGANTITLAKNTGFAELQFITLAYAPSAPATPSAPVLTAASDSGTSSSDRNTNVTTPTFIGTGAVGSAITLRVNGIVFGETVVDAAGNWSVATTTALYDGLDNVTVTATNAGGVTVAAPASTNVIVDTVAPMTGTPIFTFDHGLQIFTPATGANDLDYAGTVPTLIKASGGAVPPLIRVGQDASGVRYGFGSMPANADYSVTTTPAAVRDLAGNLSTTTASATFFILAGDVNRDRVVNFDDLVILSQNYNLTGRTFVQADLTNDGVVNFDDLVILSQNYNASLPPLVVAARVVADKSKKPRETGSI